MQKTRVDVGHGKLGVEIDKISGGYGPSRAALIDTIQSLHLDDGVAVRALKRLDGHFGVRGGNIAVLQAQGALRSKVQSAAELASLARD